MGPARLGEREALDIVTSQMLRRALPLFTALAIGVLTLSIAAILTLGREIFVPFALGILLAFILAPIVIGCSAAACRACLRSRARSLPPPSPSWRSASSSRCRSPRWSARSLLPPHGPTEAAIAVGFRAGERQRPVQPGRRRARGDGRRHPAPCRARRDGGGQRCRRAPAPRPIPVTVENESSLFDTISAIALPLLQPLATFGVVIIFAIFILLQREDLRNRFIRLAGTDDLQQTTAAIDDAARRLSKLLLFQLGVNAAFGVVTALGLWLLGVPSPALWGHSRRHPALHPLCRRLRRRGPAHAARLRGRSRLVDGDLDRGPLSRRRGDPFQRRGAGALRPLHRPVAVAILLAATIWAFLWGPVGLILATP